MLVSGAGLRVPANGVVLYPSNIDRDVGVHTKISLSVSRRVVSPACIAGVLVSPPELQRPMRSDENVTTAQQLQVVSSSVSFARAWHGDRRRKYADPWTNCKVEPLDKRRVQCRRVLGVIEGFIESPRSSNQRSSFDLHDTLIPARLENLAIETSWSKDASDSVTLLS